MVKRTYAAAPAGLLLLGMVFVAGTAAAHDAPGNNGTVKVDGAPNSEGNANEPHVGCAFRLKFMHFDDGQTGDVVIDGHAPSGSGKVSEKDDVTVGGTDATLDYTRADLDLSGLTPHPKQGYHLKLTVTTDDGVKHKVFWYGCLPESPSPTVLPTEISGSPSESASVSESPSASVSASVSGSPTESASVLPTELTNSPSASVSASVLGVKIVRSPGAQVLGTTLNRPSGLPFTGVFAAALATLAGGALATGAVLLAVARRRAKHAA